MTADSRREEAPAASTIAASVAILGDLFAEMQVPDARHSQECDEGAHGSSAARLQEVPAPGEAVPLVELGSHCRGAVFLDGNHLHTPELEEAIEHLILDQVDVTDYGEWLLDDNVVDVADYFD